MIIEDVNPTTMVSTCISLKRKEIPEKLGSLRGRSIAKCAGALVGLAFSVGLISIAKNLEIFQLKESGNELLNISNISSELKTDSSLESITNFLVDGVTNYNAAVNQLTDQLIPKLNAGQSGMLSSAIVVCKVLYDLYVIDLKWPKAVSYHSKIYNIFEELREVREDQWDAYIIQEMGLDATGEYPDLVQNFDDFYSALNSLLSNAVSVKKIWKELDWQSTKKIGQGLRHYLLSLFSSHARIKIV